MTRKQMTPREAAEFVKSHGRMGDTELIHVNKIELGILAQHYPLTVNPDTGQPEAFLPLLLALLGGSLGPSIGLSTALASGIGSFAGGLLEGQDPLTAAGTAALSAATGGIGGDAMDAAGDVAAQGVMNQTTNSLGGNLASAAAETASAAPVAADFGTRLMAGGQSLLENPSALMMNLAMDSIASDAGSDKGPKLSKTKDIPENFPGMQRSDMYTAAPADYNSGSQGEWNNFGFRGFAGGGMVPSGPQTQPGQLQDLVTGKRGRPMGGGWAGQDQGYNPLPVVQRGAPPIRDWRSMVAGSTGEMVNPTSVAAPQGLAMNFVPAPSSGRLAMARQGYASGGEVEHNSNPADNWGIFKFGLLPMMMQASEGEGPLAFLGLGQKKKEEENPNTMFAPGNVMNRQTSMPGYADGGMVAPVQQAIAPSGSGIAQGGGGNQDAQLVKMAVAAVMGQLPPEQAQQVIQAFVQRFGQAALQDLAKRVGSNQGGRQVSGPGDGLSDSVNAQIDGGQPAALSSGEYVIPAQAVADLGNGSNEAGSRQLDGMVQRARMARGGPVNPPRIDPRKVMPA